MIGYAIDTFGSILAKFNLGRSDCSITKISCMNVVNVADWKEILFNMFCLLVSLLLAVRKQERVYKMNICLMFITFPYCPWFNPADISRFKWLWWHYNYLHSVCKPGSNKLIFMFTPFWAAHEFPSLHCLMVISWHNFCVLIKALCAAVTLLGCGLSHTSTHVNVNFAV